MAGFWDNFKPSNQQNNQQSQGNQQVNPSAAFTQRQQPQQNRQFQTIDNQPQFRQQPQQNNQQGQGNLNLEELFSDPFTNYNSQATGQQALNGGYQPPQQQFNQPQNPSQQVQGGIQTQQTGTAQAANQFTPVSEIDSKLSQMDTRLQELSAKFNDPDKHYRDAQGNMNQQAYNKDYLEFQNLNRTYMDLASRRTISFQQQGNINQQMKSHAMNFLNSNIPPDMPPDMQKEIASVFAQIYRERESSGEFTKPYIFEQGGKEGAFALMYNLALGAVTNNRYQASRNSNIPLGNNQQAFMQNNQQQPQQPQMVLPNNVNLNDLSPRAQAMYAEYIENRGMERKSVGEMNRIGQMERQITMLAGYNDGSLQAFLQNTPDAIPVFQRMQQKEQLQQMRQNGQQYNNVDQMNQDFYNQASQLAASQTNQGQGNLVNQGQGFYNPQQSNQQFQRPNQIPMQQNLNGRNY